VAVGKFDQFFAFRGACGERFLDQHVLAGEKGGFGEPMMEADCRGDDDGIQLGVGEELVEILIAGDPMIEAAYFLEPIGVDVADGLQSAVAECGEVADKIGSPVATTDDPDARFG
jgi:hypothetical protein